MWCVVGKKKFSCSLHSKSCINLWPQQQIPVAAEKPIFLSLIAIKNVSSKSSDLIGKHAPNWWLKWIICLLRVAKTMSCRREQTLANKLTAIYTSGEGFWFDLEGNTEYKYRESLLAWKAGLSHGLDFLTLLGNSVKHTCYFTPFELFSLQKVTRHLRKFFK